MGKIKIPEGYYNPILNSNAKDLLEEVNAYQKWLNDNLDMNLADDKNSNREKYSLIRIHNLGRSICNLSKLMLLDFAHCDKNDLKKI